MTAVETFRQVMTAFPSDVVEDLAIERALVQWPTVAHLCELKALGFVGTVDDFLGYMPEQELSHALNLADDFYHWSDPYDLETWPHEYLFLVIQLYENETGGDWQDVDGARLSIRLMNLIYLEAETRRGGYSWIEPHSLLPLPDLGMPTHVSRRTH